MLSEDLILTLKKTQAAVLWAQTCLELSFIALIYFL